MKDYAKLIKEIETLQKQADVVRRKEIAGVIARIKEAIAAYGLTAFDLGLGVADTSKKVAAPARFSGFADDQGHTWSGRGPRPAWLRSAIEAGQSIEQFRVKTSSAKAASPKTGRRAGKPKFGDDHGNTWTGHGRRPQWFLDAIASGKTADDLVVR